MMNFGELGSLYASALNDMEQNQVGKRDREILNLFRKTLIDKALDDGDEKRFKELTSINWERHVMEETDDNGDDWDIESLSNMTQMVVDKMFKEGGYSA